MRSPKFLKGFVENGCSVICTNANSLFNKKDELWRLIEERKAHIVAITEVMAANKRDIDTSELSFLGYDGFFNLVPVLGVAIYVKSEGHAQPCEVLNSKMFSESIWCSFETEVGSMLIGCVYRSPNSDAGNNNDLLELLHDASNQSFDYLLIMGDFNYPGIRWDGTFVGGKEGEFVDCLQESYLLQMVRQPTTFRQGQTPKHSGFSIGQ